MGDAAEKLYEEALDLPPGERRQLALRLLASAVDEADHGPAASTRCGASCTWGETPWRIASGSTMADAVLDANVLVGWLDAALLVVLQRTGAIGDVVSFDQGLDAAVGFRRVA